MSSQYHRAYNLEQHLASLANIRGLVDPAVLEALACVEAHLGVLPPSVHRAFRQGRVHHDQNAIRRVTKLRDEVLQALPTDAMGSPDRAERLLHLLNLVLFDLKCVDDKRVKAGKDFCELMDFLLGPSALNSARGAAGDGGDMVANREERLRAVFRFAKVCCNEMKMVSDQATRHAEAMLALQRAGPAAMADSMAYSTQEAGASDSHPDVSGVEDFNETPLPPP